MRTDIVRRIIEAYDDPIVRVYCWARFWILRQQFLHPHVLYIATKR
jgi:hypothetical protein